MKPSVGVALVVVLAAWEASAFPLKKDVYRMDRLEAAVAEAKAEGKPLTFLYTDENTTCPKCEASSLAVIETLHKRTVLLYVAPEVKDLSKLPKAVRDGIRKPEMGDFIPKTVVVDPGLTNLIAIVPYALGDEQDRLLKDARKKITSAMAKGKDREVEPAKPLQVSAKPPAVIRPDETRELRAWKSQTGAEVKASLVQEDGLYVVLKKEDGAKVKIALLSLSKADQEYVARLKEPVAAGGAGSKKP
jgi:hypothetical protein